MKIRYCFLTILTLLAFIALSDSMTAQGVIGSWSFSGNANDGTGNGNNGTVNGATLIPDRFGNTNSAYLFNGSSDYISVPHNSAFNFDTAFAISLWFKFCTGQGGVNYTRSVCLFGKGSQSSEVGYGVDIYSRSQKYFFFGDRSMSPTSFAVYTNSPLDDRKWHHAVVMGYDTTIGAGTYRRYYLFIDGSYKSTGLTVAPNYSANQSGISIGRNVITGDYFNGGIDDIQVYNRRLSPSEISGLYGQGGWPLTASGITVQTTNKSLGPICPGDSVQLGATASATGVKYVWSPKTGLSSDTVANPKAAPSGTIKYTVTALKLGSPELCPDTVKATDTVLVIVNVPPKLTLPSPVVYVCKGDVAQLTVTAEGNGPFQYRWSPGATLSDSTIAQPKATPSLSTLYRVTVTDSKGCKKTDSMSVSVYPAPVASAGRDTSLCRGDAVYLGSPLVFQHTYLWTPATGLDFADVAQPQARPDTTTTYYLKVVAPSGCIARDTVTITVRPAAKADAGADASICVGASTTIGTASQSGYIYSWSPSTGLNNAAIAMPTARPTTTTMYHLTARLANGCEAYDSVLVTVLNAKLAVDRDTVTFGELDGCTSTHDVLMPIHNTSETEALVTAADFSASGFALVSPLLPFHVKPGATDTLVLRFAPTKAGAASAKLTLSGDPCNLSMSMWLQGSKQKSDVAVDVAAIDFGRRLACDEIDTTVQVAIINSGTTPATVESALISPPYLIVSPTMPQVINPAETLKVTVRYAPTSAGTFKQDLRLAYQSGSCRDTLRVAFNGMIDNVELKSSLNVVDFGLLGGCDVGRDRTFTLSNSGSFDITVDSASVPAGFKLLTGLPIVVGAGKSVQVQARFEPASAGTYNADLVLNYTPCDGQLRITFTGVKEGVSFSVPDTINFGEVVDCKGGSSTEKLLISYSGESGSSGSIRSVQINGPFTTTAKVGASLTNGSPTEFAITFTPTTDGPISGWIDIGLDPCGVTRRIELRGSRVSAAIAASNFEFGLLNAGDTATHDVAYANTGSASVTIDRIDGLAKPFGVVNINPQLPATLAPGDTLHVVVRYAVVNGVSTDTVSAHVVQPCDFAVGAMMRGAGQTPTEATATVRLPKITARSGDIIKLPVILKSSSGLDVVNARNFSAVIVIDRRLAMPTRMENIVDDGSNYRIAVNGVRQSNDTLATVEMVVLLGRGASSALKLDAFSWTDATVTTAREDGSLDVAGINERGGARLSDTSHGVSLKPSRPNPATDIATIEYELAQAGQTELSIVDMTGRRVALLVDGGLTPGQYVAWLDVAKLANGSYVCVLRTPSVVLTERFEVRR